MFITIITLVSVVNIIAQNYNYNINATRNPDFDIRVRRDLNKNNEILTPEENNNLPTKETPLLLDILRRDTEEKTEDIITKVKRDTYQQNTQIYNGINEYNGNSNLGHFKTKPDFIAKTYNKVVQVFGRKTTPTHNSVYANYNSIKVNDSGYANQYNGANYAFNNQMNNNDRFYSPFNATNYYMPVPYGSNQTTPTYNSNTNYNNGYNGFSTPMHNGIPLAPYNNQFNNYNTSMYNSAYAPYNYNNYNPAVNATFNRYNGTSFVPYNYTPMNSNYNRYNGTLPYYPAPNSTYNTHNETSFVPYRNNENINPSNGNVTTTTERIIAEGCLFCQTFNCPVNQKRVGFKCVDIDYDY